MAFNKCKKPSPAWCLSFFPCFFSVLTYAENDYYQAVHSRGYGTIVYSVDKKEPLYYEQSHKKYYIDELDTLCGCCGHDCIKQDHFCDGVKIKWLQLKPDPVKITSIEEDESDSCPPVDYVDDKESDSAPENTPKGKGINFLESTAAYALVKRVLKLINTERPKPEAHWQQVDGDTTRQPITVKNAAISHGLFEQLKGKLPVYDYKPLFNEGPSTYYYTLNCMDYACCCYCLFGSPFVCILNSSIPAGATSAMVACFCDLFCVIPIKQSYRKSLNFTTIDVAMVVDFHQNDDDPDSNDYASRLLAAINTSTSKLFSHFAGVIDFDHLPELQMTDKGRIVIIMRLKILDNDSDHSCLKYTLLKHQKTLKNLEKEGKTDELYIPLFSYRDNDDKLFGVGKLLKTPPVIDEQPQPYSVLMGFP